MSYWFLRFSGDSRHVAGGHIRIQEDDVDIAPGTGPRYADSNTIFYARQPDGAFMRAIRGTNGYSISVIREEGFNFYDIASNGRWVGYRADPPRLIWDDGVVWSGWADGDISNTRWAARHHQNSALYAGTGVRENSTLIDPRGCSDVRLSGEVLTWSVGDDIFGQRAHGARVEPWSIEGQSHFWPVPVWIGGKLYVLTHTFDTLMLYEAREGQTHGYIINVGISDFPDVVAIDATRVRIGWTDKGVKHERILNIATEPLVDLRPVKEEPALEDTSGLSVDPLPYMFGDHPQRDGDHYMCWFIDAAKKRWYEIKFGSPDSWEAFYWDVDKVGLWEDRSQSEPSYNPPWDYAFTEDVMFTRPMKPGVKIPHPNNEWIRFDPRTNKIIDRGPAPFHQWIGRVYLNYPFGGVVGNRPAFESNSQSVGVSHLERNIYALGAGRCLFQIVRIDTDQVVFQTKFVNAGGPRLTPTVGGRDTNIANWPPKKKIIGMTITSFQEDVITPRSRAVANPNPGEEWSREISWWYAPDGTEDWVQQDHTRNPQEDNDHTFRFPGPGRYKIRQKWESGQTGIKRVVTVRA